jgi:hypothetical protein
MKTNVIIAQQYADAISNSATETKMPLWCCQVWIGRSDVSSPHHGLVVKNDVAADSTEEQ